MAGAKLVVDFTGRSTELAQTVNGVKQMLSSLGQTAAQAANPGKSSGIARGIDDARKQISLMKGNYDEVTAAAIEFRRRGAPQSLISEYIALRREIARLAQEKQAAADADLARIKRNADYEAAQERLRDQRHSARLRNTMPGGAGGRMGGGGNSMLFPMAMNSLAVGFQDAVSVYQVNKSMLAAISAAGNNIIFLMTLINPMYGAITAIVLGLTQLGVAWLQSGDRAEEATKKEQDALKRSAQLVRERIELQQKLAKASASDIKTELDSRRSTLEARKAEGREMIGADDETFAGVLQEIRNAKALVGVAQKADWRKDPVARQRELVQTTLLDEAAQKRVELAVLKGANETLAWAGEMGQAGVVGYYVQEWAKDRNQRQALRDKKDADEKAARERQEQNETAKRAKEADQERRRNEANALRERLKSPKEKFQEEVRGLGRQYDAGDIDRQTYDRGLGDVMKRRQQELLKELPERIAHAPSLIRGSVEAARIATTGRSDERAQQARQQMIFELQEMNRQQRELVRQGTMDRRVWTKPVGE